MGNNVGSKAPSQPVSWVVHKFGGTSVGGSEQYKKVATLIDNGANQSQGIVVSAMSKVTNALIETVQLAEKRDESYLKQLGALKQRHLSTAQELLGPNAAGPLLSIFETDFEDIREILRGIWLIRTASERTIDLISGYGEIWSAQLLSAYLKKSGRPCRWLDARQVLVVEPNQRSVIVNWDLSQEKLNRWLKEEISELIIITGFIASTQEGIATTLKRNGSDFSASIFGSLLDASTITIWTDVDGVMSSDPRLVPDAVILDELSYNEMTELAYFGAKVVHPSTMAPAIKKGIPIWIRNTFNPGFPGTKIHSQAKSEHLVKGLAAIEDIALVNVEGTGMVGVPGVAERLFSSLRQADLSVVMISQACSEHSICFAVPEKQVSLATLVVEKAFFGEIQLGQIQTVSTASECSILAAVGDNMAQTPGVAAAFFIALARVGINVRAIAQGSSERNISAVINRRDVVRALRAAHSAFYLSNQTISLGLIGPGLIGKAFLKQLKSQLEFLRSNRKIDVRVRGIMNSKQMLLHDQGIDLETWESHLDEKSQPSNLEAFVQHLRAEHLPHSVIIDATASSEIPLHYPAWLEKGMNVITPNKKANTAPLKFYKQLKSIARATNKYYFYSTTVGAGLPVIHSLQDLIQTGDKVDKIEGVLSGTLSYIFNSWTKDRAFSEIILEAKQKGYTEPDPRDDLSGMDVARKLVILGREMGLTLELSDVQVENLVPEKLRSGDVESFLIGLRDFDGEMVQKLEESEKNNQVLRYVGTITGNGKAQVRLSAYPRSHPFSGLHGSDNIVSYHTSRYSSLPLIVRGPGAGPEVTASGVFADLLRLASYLGAPL